MDCSVENWVSTEFSGINFGDKRLGNRLQSIIRGLIKHAQANISCAFPNWAEIKACYRFLDNDKVDESLIFAGHQAKTLERLRQETVVLLIQDTTYLDYKNRPKTTELDYINRTSITKNPVHGLLLHSTLALSTEGVPLGLLSQKFVERKSFQGGRACPGSEKKKAIEAKESIRWLEVLKQTQSLDTGSTKKIHIADREGDIYEFYREANLLNELFVVRVKSNRTINKVKRREKASQKLFDHLEKQAIQGKLTVSVQVNGEQKFREATLSIMFANVTIPPPADRTVNKNGGYLPMLPLTAIMAVEHHPPTDVEPIQWVLLSNVSTQTVDEAIEQIKWYSYRWNIEIFHKILKSGCSVESAQLRKAKKLKKYVTLKSIVAWRLFWLTRFFEKEKQATCEGLLTGDEWSILYRKFNKNQLPSEPPTVRDIYYWIARLGGYINRKSDPPPGVISIWKGWTRFMDLIEDYVAFCG